MCTFNPFPCYTPFFSPVSLRLLSPRKMQFSGFVAYISEGEVNDALSCPLDQLDTTLTDLRCSQRGERWRAARGGRQRRPPRSSSATVRLLSGTSRGRHKSLRPVGTVARCEGRSTSQTHSSAGKKEEQLGDVSRSSVLPRGTAAHVYATTSRVPMPCACVLPGDQNLLSLATLRADTTAADTPGHVIYVQDPHEPYQSGSRAGHLTPE